MTNNVILTSADFVRANTSISDNMNGKLLHSVIVEAQEIDLQRIIGNAMLMKLKHLVQTGTVHNEGNEAYDGLLDKVQYYLAYEAVSKLCVLSTYKIDNAGLLRSSDENIEIASEDEVFDLSSYWQKKADWFAYDMQNYILDNIQKLPEINEAQHHQIKSCMHSAASSSLFLGGARGRGWRRWPYRHKYND